MGLVVWIIGAVILKYQQCCKKSVLIDVAISMEGQGELSSSSSRENGGTCGRKPQQEAG